MCTVTFLPLEDGDFILSSNRDINLSRKPAEQPNFENQDGCTLLFPKDGEAGGTWIGLRDNHRAVVLLNGAFVMHHWNPPYRLSRGIVVKEALCSDDPIRFFNQYPLSGIEPFTLILLDWKDQQLTGFEWVWDETESHIRSLDQNPEIWSSAPLYDQNMKALRESWFKNWLINTANPSVDSIRKWHLETGEGDPITDLVTKRGFLETVSLTTVEKRGKQSRMIYQDLIQKQSSDITFHNS